MHPSEIELDEDVRVDRDDLDVDPEHAELEGDPERADLDVDHDDDLEDDQERADPDVDPELEDLDVDHYDRDGRPRAHERDRDRDRHDDLEDDQDVDRAVPPAGDWLSRAPGDGSLPTTEAFVHETAYTANDGRSTTQTTFYPGDVEDASPDERSKWERLAQLNDGIYEPSRGAVNHRVDKERTASILAGTLGLSSFERDRFMLLVDEIEFSQFSNASYEQTMLAICSLIRDEQLSRYAGSSDRDDRELLERRLNPEHDAFEALMDDVELTFTEYRSLRQQLREKTSQF